MVKSVDPNKLDTNELRDFWAEAEIVENKIKDVRVLLQPISTAYAHRRPDGNVHIFTAEGTVGIIVKNLDELKGNLNSLGERIKPVKRTLIGSLTDLKKE